MTELDPAAALATVTQTRSALADRVATPWWYHLAIALTVGAQFAAFAGHRLNIVFWVNVLVVLVQRGLQGVYRRTRGVWISGALAYRRGRARRAAYAKDASGAALCGIALTVDWALHLRWAWLVAGALAVPVYTMLSRWHDNLLRAELREGA